MGKVELTRQELYDLVWSKPMSRLALEYNISDNGLRKICKKHEIPLPLLGHWQKIQYNKKVKIIPLSKDFKGEDSIILNKGGTKENEEITNFHKLLKEITNDTKLSFNVPDRISNPDKLITEAKNNFEFQKKQEYSIYRGLIRTTSGYLNINVAPKNISRALRIMDKIIKLLKLRGHNVIVKGDTTYAIVKGEEIKIRCREKLKKNIKQQENYSWNYTEYFASDVLSFIIDEYPEKEFYDTNNQILEEQLPKILTKLELVSEKLKTQREEREIWNEEYRKKREAEEAIKKRHANEIENFRNLLENSERWKKATDLRNFIKELESNAIKENKLSEELSNWIKWSNDKADWFDPLVNKNDDLLTEKDKEEILSPKKPNNNYYRY
ncbi:MAG: hypothetical protein KAZ71_08910 [Bacteroidia bacterium]|nr:hypothetical protein [Bacteroidia bacterium]